MVTATKQRGGRRPAAQLSQPDYPFTMKLPDGRIVYVEVPGRWVSKDRSGEPTFLPPAMAFLDRVQALAMSALDRTPSPGYITSLREALGLTQKQLGERVNVNKMTVSRWERGTLQPSVESLAALEKVRKDAARRGVVLPFAKPKSRRN